MSLPLQAQQRNARYRAWRGIGTPARAGWEIVAGLWHFWLRCDACGFLPFFPVQNLTLPRGYTSLEAAEHYFFAQFKRRRPWCEHLAPLLQPAPPALAALYDLELLAGE